MNLHQKRYWLVCYVQCTYTKYGFIKMKWRYNDFVGTLFESLCDFDRYWIAYLAYCVYARACVCFIYRFRIKIDLNFMRNGLFRIFCDWFRIDGIFLLKSIIHHHNKMWWCFSYWIMRIGCINKTEKERKKKQREMTAISYSIAST